MHENKINNILSNTEIQYYQENGLSPNEIEEIKSSRLMDTDLFY